MQKQKIRDLILKTEEEVIQLPAEDPLMIRGREFLQKIPPHKIDSLLERSNDEMLSHLISFFHFLIKREDISSVEKDRIRTFIKAGKIERMERKEKKSSKMVREQVKEIEIQKSILRGLYEMVKTKNKLLYKELDVYKEVVKDNQQAIKSFKFILFLLSILNCIELTIHGTISFVKGHAVKLRTVTRALLSASIVIWTGYSLFKRK